MFACTHGYVGWPLLVLHKYIPFGIIQNEGLRPPPPSYHPNQYNPSPTHTYIQVSTKTFRRTWSFTVCHYVHWVANTHSTTAPLCTLPPSAAPHSRPCCPVEGRYHLLGSSEWWESVFRFDRSLPNLGGGRG